MWLRRGSLTLLKSPSGLETANTTVKTFQKQRALQKAQKLSWNYSANYSSARPPPNRIPKDDQGSDDTSNFKPVNLSYRALECRGKQRDCPTKTPLIIHHSLLGRKENWNPISEIINRVTQRKIINVDARNHGESPHTLEMSLPLMTNDLIHLVHQMWTENGPCCTKEKFSFMGHSMGGKVGILLALLKPHLLDKLIVVDTPITANENSRKRWTNLRTACYVLVQIESDLKKLEGYERLNAANRAIENIITEKKDRAHFLSNLILSDEPEDGTSLWRVNLEAFLSHPEMICSLPTFHNATFEGQTLFISGTKSKFMSKHDEREILKVFPNAEIAWLKDCGHLLHIDKQKEFCEKVITFLEE